ncbi:MAG: glycosyltransferase family 2 protein [Flavobacteriales bacterium]|jgi:glycosyltransferase involved in cell wall biosynthesis|tara:strand:- start:25220 stop:26167 length:948 start_codon:yes stop_codon:yes gene_type:complete
MHISVIVPSYNEFESLPELCSWIGRVMDENKFSYEVIIVDDGSTDNTWKVIQQLSSEIEQVKGVKFRRNYGKSAALNVGFEKAKGDVVITMDADLQDSPDEIPQLYSMIVTDGFDMVSGWKQKRFDPITKTIPTKLYNWAARKASGIYLHDFNCGLKSYKNEVIKNIEVYGEMHRYIPMLAKRAGFPNIGEKVVVHQSRKYGVTKFGIERFVNGFLDLMTITFVSKFGKKPMHFFGVLGTLMFFLGLLLFFYIGGSKLYYTFNGVSATNIADMSSFYIALTSMLMGLQLFLAGFIGEMISRNAEDRNQYHIEESV